MGAQKSLFVHLSTCGNACPVWSGTSKSQLLGFVHKIAPRGMYTSGKGSSAVGLTAYITKDPDTKEPVLESGALVRGRGGFGWMCVPPPQFVLSSRSCALWCVLCAAVVCPPSLPPVYLRYLGSLAVTGAF